MTYRLSNGTSNPMNRTLSYRFSETLRCLENWVPDVEHIVIAAANNE